ncbi:G-protein beta WD-40 repeats containing protein, partial [Reticulomyxa filosa]
MQSEKIASIQPILPLHWHILENLTVKAFYFFYRFFSKKKKLKWYYDIGPGYYKLTLDGLTSLTNSFSIIYVYNIDYITFGSHQFICSGSHDPTVCIWDVDNNKQIQLLNGYSNAAYCVKFSSYYYQNNNENVICYSSNNRNIYFWDFKQNKLLQTFNKHKKCVYGIEFSSFNGSRYLFSGSLDKTIRLWD